jgi:molecular chaperone HtpG
MTTSTTQEHGFKAEVQQLLNLMIHSVYSDREVFLRELVSNAADALDKVKFLELTNPALRPAGHDPAGIRLSFDKDARTLTIEDDGIGLTETDAVEHLGTIARSGTKAFLEQLAKDGASAPKLIGQFGLGFYSAFMVADRVVVESLAADPEAAPVRWTSEGKGSFQVEAGARTARGTAITLHLREDSGEYLEAFKLKGIVRKHSNFLPHPIFVLDAGKDEQVNAGKALWLEPPSKVTDEEAATLYRSVATDWEDPARRVHIAVDSPLQVGAILFVPRKRPWDLFQPDGTKGPKLYARRVLIEEHAKELLPEWMRFLRGVVDSEDIPLNVSREMVQKTPVVKKIREVLVKKVLKDLADWAEAPAPESAEAPTYADFWKNFGMLLKEGWYHEHGKLGELLTPLLRFNTTTHADADGLTSLAEYRKAMPAGQDAIWYLTGESRASLLASPHLEAFKKRGWTVLLLTDPVDEWFVQSFSEYEGMPVKSVARGALDLKDDEAEAGEKADLTAFAPWLHGVLGERVSAVRPSTRLTDSAVVLVDAEDGMSANMERILKQVGPDAGGGRSAKRVLEVNPRHPLIRNLAELQSKGQGERAQLFAEMLYDDALLLEGQVQEPAAMGRRLQELLTRASSPAA